MDIIILNYLSELNSIYFLDQLIWIQYYVYRAHPGAENPHRNHLKDFNYSQARNNSLKTNWRLLPPLPLLLHNNLAWMRLDG